MGQNVVRIWISRRHLADLGWSRDLDLYDPETRDLMGWVQKIDPGRAGGVDVTIAPCVARPDQSRGAVLTWVKWSRAWPEESMPGVDERLAQMEADGVI